MKEMNDSQIIQFLFKKVVKLENQVQELTEWRKQIKQKDYEKEIHLITGLREYIDQRNGKLDELEENRMQRIDMIQSALEMKFQEQLEQKFNEIKKQFSNDIISIGTALQ